MSDIFQVEWHEAGKYYVLLMARGDERHAIGSLRTSADVTRRIVAILNQHFGGAASVTERGEA